MQVSQAQQASIAERPRQYSLQELPFTNVKSIGSRGSVLMLAVRFEEVVSRGAGAAVALFSGAVIREMYRTKILSVKVCLPLGHSLQTAWDVLLPTDILLLSRSPTDMPLVPQISLFFSSQKLQYTHCALCLS